MNFENYQKINIKDFDTSNVGAKFLLSYGDRHFEVSESVMQLIETLKESLSTIDAAEKFSEQRGIVYAPSDIELICEKIIAPIWEMNNKLPAKKSPFLWQKELIPASVVAFVPRYLKILFSAKIMVAFVALIVVSEVSFFSFGFTVSNIGQVNILVFAGVLLLFICSSIAHEFGHATASSYCKAESKGIGMGLYMNFPVFYTDVSDIWKLTRKQRTLVNFGGVYFQCLFLLPLFVIYFITWSDFLKYFIITVNLNFILTLNPFFKFDGYWIMSDLLGVPNLRGRSTELFRYYWNKLRGRRVAKEPYMLSLKKSSRAIFIGYAVVVNIFFLYYFCYIMPKFLIYFVENFPRMAKQMVEMIAMGQMPPMQFIMNALGQLVMIAFMILMLYKLIKSLVRKVLTK